MILIQFTKLCRRRHIFPKGKRIHTATISGPSNNHFNKKAIFNIKRARAGYLLLELYVWMIHGLKHSEKINLCGTFENEGLDKIKIESCNVILLVLEMKLEMVGRNGMKSFLEMSLSYPFLHWKAAIGDSFLWWMWLSYDIWNPFIFPLCALLYENKR